MATQIELAMKRIMKVAAKIKKGEDPYITIRVLQRGVGEKLLYEISVSWFDKFIEIHPTQRVFIQHEQLAQAVQQTINALKEVNLEREKI